MVDVPVTGSRIYAELEPGSKKITRPSSRPTRIADALGLIAVGRRMDPPVSGSKTSGGSSERCNAVPVISILPSGSSVAAPGQSC